MIIPTLYLETTMFNFYFSTQDLQKKADTLQLFRWIAEGRFKPYIFDIVLEELRKAPPAKCRLMTDLVQQYAMTLLLPDAESRALADLYVDKGIIPIKYANDALLWYVEAQAR